MNVSFTCCVLSGSGLYDGLLVYRGPTECGVSECDRGALVLRRPWLTRCFCALRKIYARSSKWSLTLRSTHYNPVYTSPLPRACYMQHSYHSSSFGIEQHISHSSSLCSLLHSPVTSSLLDPNIFLSTFSRTHPENFPPSL